MLLAIDTSTKQAGIALYDGARGLVAEYNWHSANRHTEELMPAVAQMLAQAGVTPGALRAVAVALGPGSFTGLRVGLAAAKGLALAHGLTLLGIPTLDVVAYPHQAQPVPVIAVLQAGRGRVYWAPYAHGPSGWAARSQPRLSTVPELANTVVRPLMFVGEVSGADQRDADQLGRPAAGELPAGRADYAPRRATWPSWAGCGSKPGSRTTPRPSARSICSSRTARSGRVLQRSGHAVSTDLVTVAPMTPDDLDEIMPLERQCFADPWTRRMYLSDLTTNEAATYLVLRRGDAATRRHGEGQAVEDDFAVSPIHRVPVSPVLAYGGLWLLLDEAHIATVASHPDWRGCGLGQWLMLALLDAADRAGGREFDAGGARGQFAGQTPLREAGIRGRRRAQTLLSRRRGRPDHDHAAAGRTGDAGTAGRGAAGCAAPVGALF